MIILEWEIGAKSEEWEGKKYGGRQLDLSLSVIDTRKSRDKRYSSYDYVIYLSKGEKSSLSGILGPGINCTVQGTCEILIFPELIKKSLEVPFLAILSSLTVPSNTYKLT